MSRRADLSPDSSTEKAVTWYIRISPFVLVALVGAVCYLAIGLTSAQDGLTSTQRTQASVEATLRQQSITNCENNDAFRLAQVAVWEKNYVLQAQESTATSVLLAQLITTLARGDPAEIRRINSILAQSGKAGSSEVTAFLAFVKKEDAPKNCQALYTATGG